MTRNSAGTRNAIVLLSGGLDSATVLAMALKRGLTCRTLAIDYGQRHKHELAGSAELARRMGVADHRQVSIDLRAIGGSALTDDIDVPKSRGIERRSREIPVTYVPARNMIFLSIAAGYAEVSASDEIHIGVNSVDYSGYPDCREAFIQSMQRTIELGTKAGVEGRPVKVETPLVNMSKAEIIRTGAALGVNYAMTYSCYDPKTINGEHAACGACDACIIRHDGFVAAGVVDPTVYAPGVKFVVRHAPGEPGAKKRAGGA